jgi:hypothetical protein
MTKSDEKGQDLRIESVCGPMETSTIVGFVSDRSLFLLKLGPFRLFFSPNYQHKRAQQSNQPNNVFFQNVL